MCGRVVVSATAAGWPTSVAADPAPGPTYKMSVSQVNSHRPTVQKGEPVPRHTVEKRRNNATRRLPPTVASGQADVDLGDQRAQQQFSVALAGGRGVEDRAQVGVQLRNAAPAAKSSAQRAGSSTIGGVTCPHRPSRVIFSVSPSRSTRRTSSSLGRLAFAPLAWST